MTIPLKNSKMIETALMGHFNQDHMKTFSCTLASTNLFKKIVRTVDEDNSNSPLQLTSSVQLYAPGDLVKISGL